MSAAVGADGAVAVAYRSPNCSVYGAYRPPGGRFVSSLLYRPRSVERMCDQPGVIIGGGRATAAWQQSDGARVRAVARDFGAGGASRPSVFSTLATYVREGRRSACWPRRSTTIARNDVARVFVRKASRDEREVEGCFFRRGARVSLQSIDARTGRPFFILNQKLVTALAGPLAAYVDSVRCSGDCDETDWENKGLFIDDLRGGTANFADVDDEGEVEQIVLNPRGSAAWIQCSASCSRRGTRRTVYLLQFSESSERRVSQGPGVAAKSLRLRGQTVTWVENGRVRRTRLR